MRCLLLAVALSTALASLAPGPAALDIRHVELTIRPDFAARRLAITARLDIDGTAGPLELGLADAWERVEAFEGDEPLALSREAGAMALALPAGPSPRRIRIELAGPSAPSADEKREWIGKHDLFLLWSDRFYPIAFDDWSTYRITVLLPPGFETVAPGRRVDRRPDGALVAHVFETSQPTRCVSVFADDRWIAGERTVGPWTIRTLLHPSSAAHHERLVTTSADVLGFYTKLHGFYPHDDFAFVTIEGLYARRAFPGFVGYSPAYLDREMQRTGYDAHETALLWWGYASGGRGPGSFQWTEGLGDYVEFLYAEARGLPLPANFARFREEYLATPKDEDRHWSELRGNSPQKLVHGRYPWVMQSLRTTIGDASFRAGLRSLFERYRFGTFTLDEFVATMAEAAGRPLDAWRARELEQPPPRSRN